ncbi:NUDIX hydrolase [Patescibacteria group bacterium]|jgi:ADP-ribose pyrophosphatase|nr:NUDIX hydrolase [Patescibacteria group bacterium]
MNFMLAPGTDIPSEKAKHLHLRTIIDPDLTKWAKQGEPRMLAKQHGLSLVAQNFVHPKTGKVEEYTQFTKSPGFTIVPVTTDGELIIVRQYKQAVDDFVYEFPAGLMKADEATTTHATTELLEETGCRPTRVLRLTERMIELAPRKSPSGYHLFIALGCQLIKEQDLEEDEDAIQVLVASTAEVAAMIIRGEFRSTESVTAFLLAQLHGHFNR